MLLKCKITPKEGAWHLKVFVFIVFFCSAWFVNLGSSLKFPDIEPTWLGFFISLVYCSLLTFIKQRWMRVFLIIGCLSSLATIVFIEFEYNTWVIGDLQYPLIFIYLVPLFGLNQLFYFPWQGIAAVCACVYFVCYLLNLFYARRNEKLIH